MLVLAIDTSTNVGSVGLFSSETGLVGEISINVKRTHSENVMKLIDDILDVTDHTIKDIDKIAVSIGPGSFTGIRIGVAAAKGLAYSLKKPIVGVNELDVLANGVSVMDKKINIIPIIDARKGRGYYSCYSFVGTNLVQKGEYCVGEISEYLADKSNIKTVFIGDGALKNKKMIEEIMGENAIFLANSLNIPRSGILAEISVDKEDNIYTLEPLYLSKTQAEREKEKREQNKK